MRESRYRDQLPAGSLDLEVEERANRRSLFFPYLRDDLVAPVVVVEPVYIRPTERGTQLLAYTGQVEPEVGDLLAIDYDSRLWQIDLEIGIDVKELAALPPGTDHRSHRLKHLLWRSVALQNQLNV